jgi:hypothetical protein
MKVLSPLLAVLAPQSKLPPPHETGPAIGPLGGDILKIVSAVVIIAAVGLVWAMVFRKRKRHHHRAKIISEAPVLSIPAFGDKPQKRRRKRKQEFPRNPTLAETGGLPTPKGPPAPPSHPQ